MGTTRGLVGAGTRCNFDSNFRLVVSLETDLEFRILHFQPSKGGGTPAVPSTNACIVDIEHSAKLSGDTSAAGSQALKNSPLVPWSSPCCHFSAEINSGSLSNLKVDLKAGSVKQPCFPCQPRSISNVPVLSTLTRIAEESQRGMKGQNRSRHEEQYM